MSVLLEKYQKEIRPALVKELGLKTPMQVPKIDKIVVNVGMGTFLQGSKDYSLIENSLIAITGQKPIVRQARLSVSNFKVREGMPVGMKVTLRGERAHDFLYKIIHVVYPRVRGFRGVKKNIFDKEGNMSFGFAEHTVFPEAPLNDSSRTHGIQVTVVTNTDNTDHARSLLEACGFPFQK